MTWEKKTISSPLVDGIENIAGQLDSAATALDNTLGTALDVLNTAKSLYAAGSDPYLAAMSAVIDELENLIKDTFGAKITYIVVHANYAENIDKVTTDNVALDFVRQRLGFKPVAEGEKKRQGRYDEWGNKLITPKEIIQVLRSSLTDNHDEFRPTSSDSGYIAALGMMITAANLQDFTPLMQRFIDVLDLKEFEKWFDDLLKSLDEADPTGETLGRAQKPDWEGKRLTDVFSGLKKQEKVLLDMVGSLRGYLNTADDAIVDLINIISKKVNVLKNIVSDLKDLIESIKNALTATGVYTMVVSGVGGANLLKESFKDPYLESLPENGYSAAVVFVAEGSNSDAAVLAIENLAELLVS